MANDTVHTRFVLLCAFVYSILNNERNQSMKSPLLALGLATLPLLGLAEDNNVIVTASRFEQPITNTLAAVTVLTEEDIERYGDSELATLLTRIAGITQTPAGSLGSTDSVQIRGASTGQMIVLIDGVQVGSASLGQANLENISLANIERIEIIRGPVSSLYGAGGIGGVIQIFTKDSVKSGDDIFVSVELGSFNYQRQSAGFRTVSEDTVATGKLSRSATNGFDSTTLEGINSDNDAFQQLSGSLSISHAVNSQTQLMIDHSQTFNDIEYDSQCYDALFNVVACGNDVDWHTKTDVITSQIKIHHEVNNSQLAAQLGRHIDESKDPENSSFFNTERYTLGLNSSTEWLQQLRTVLGFDANIESLQSSAFNDKERTNLGVYSQINAQAGDFRLQAGSRVDHNSAYDNNLTSNLTLSAFIIGDIEAIASAGTAFKAPTFNELYYPNYGDEGIKPEESQTLELAIRQFNRNGYWRVSYFKTETRNLIGTDPITFTAANIKKANMTGVEVEWQQRFENTRFDANASYINAVDGDDEPLANIPDWSGFASVTQFIGVHSVSADFQAEEGRESGGEYQDGYAVIGLGGDYRFGRNKDSRLFGRIDNVADVDYVLNHDSSNFDYNTPGRTFKVGIEYHL